MPRTPRRRNPVGGNVAMIIALVAVPVVGCVGLAVDAGAALRREEKLQAAVDSAALAALRVLPTQNDAGVRRTAQAYITTNFGSSEYTLAAVDIDRSTSKVELTATSPSHTMFGGIFGIDSMKVEVSSVAKGGGTIELVMALDNSGSMAQSGRIQALRDASTNLVAALMDDPALTNRVTIGVAPFSTAVNVGSGYRTAGWMDNSGANNLSGQNFVAGHHNFQAFDALGVAWKGCVEARSTTRDLDVNDVAPSSGAGRTLFVPMFAPDETDASNYFNDYLDDEGGACPHDTSTYTEAVRQKRWCKYENQTPRSAHPVYNIPVGPNSKCESIPLLPLTDQKALITAKLAAMTPQGNTNIVEGAAWGWRLLSPGAPFTEGKAYGTTANRKILIVMTDGENTMSGSNRNHNLADWYSAYGYPATKRLLQQATGDEGVIRRAMNDRLRLACANAKAAKVEIYSIIVTPPNDEAKQVMEDCASPGDTPKHAYAVATAGELKGVFEEIGRSIKAVRLAE